MVFLLDLPVTYVLFAKGMAATTVMEVKICVITAILFVRMFFASRLVDTIHFGKACIEVLLPMALTVIVTVGVVYVFNEYTQSSQYRLLYTLLVEAICIVMLWYVVLNRSERNSVVKFLMANHK